MHAPQPINVVLAHGCFDVAHVGHVRHLKAARALGDKLVVSITADAHVKKGINRPAFTAEQRAEVIRELDCVDDVIISASADAVDVIEQIKPAIYVKGIDYSDIQDAALQREIAAVEAHGGRFHVTRTDKWSSSRLINSQRLSDDAVAYLDRVRSRGWFDAIVAAFEAADALNILFVGETIIDEYRYVAPLAKPSKEFILATVEAREPEQFLGGVIAASLHADWKNVQVVTDDGEPIRKTRYVDTDFGRKLFEVYSKPKLDLSEHQYAAFWNKIDEKVDAADVVIVFDFGHGLISGGWRLGILEQAKFFAVNAQTNASNYGYNPVTKYGKANLVCIDMPEARLAAQMQDETQPGVLMNELAERMRFDNIIITQGRNGSVCGKPDEMRMTIPSFGARALDTMGAGDAFLATVAPLVAAGLDLEIASFVGNVAGAIKTDIVGHRRHVERAELLQTVEALLK
jgi:rfaE bifunctional protein nucleotidyltransferase chain/domain